MNWSPTLSLPRALAPIALFAITGYTADAGVLVADSAAEFSSTQGQDGWHYGYTTGNPSDPAFQPMAQYLSGEDGNNWHADEAQFWTLISDVKTHPNGTTTSGDKTPIVHWAVRRWVSDVCSEVTIAGNAMDTSDSTNGDGVEVMIVVDGAVAWSQALNAGDNVGVPFSVTAFLHIGSTVDFITTPGPSGSDHSDATIFTSQVTTNDSPFVSHGGGCAGSGTYAPRLCVGGDPSAGGTITVRCDQGLGGSFAFLFIGNDNATIPLGAGCFLNVTPTLLVLGPLPLSAGGPGQGTVDIAGQIPAGFPSTDIALQMFTADPSTPIGFATTNGVKFTTTP